MLRDAFHDLADAIFELQRQHDIRRCSTATRPADGATETRCACAASRDIARGQRNGLQPAWLIAIECALSQDRGGTPQRGLPSGNFCMGVATEQSQIRIAGCAS